MKKFIWSLITLSVLLVTPTFAQTVSTSTVVDFLYENGMTKFDTVVDFRPEAAIMRGEAAKFMNEFAKAINYAWSYAGSCTFTDIATYDYTLTPHIADVCELGLIKWSQGQYRPNATLTEAEALTILGRSQTGFEDETGARWYQGYFQKALSNWLVSNSEIDSVATTPITRWRLGLWIYMTMNPSMNTGGEITNDDDQTLESIINDIFGDDTEEEWTITSTEPTQPQETELAQRTIWATMNITEEGQTRRDGFQPYTNSQLQNALNNGVTVVLYFSADRCPSCQLLTTSLEADQFAFPEDLLVLTIDFDDQTDLVTQYWVARQHTLISLNSEWNEESRSVGTIYTLADVESEFMSR